jgi:hypothetical protein
MVIPFIISVSVFVVGLLVLFVGNLIEDRSTRERWQVASIVWIAPGVIASVIFGIVWGMSGPSDADKCTAEGKIWISERDELGPEANMCVDEQQYKTIYEVR